MQFTYNFTQLEETENENQEEEVRFEEKVFCFKNQCLFLQMETEWHIYLNTSIEIIALVSEFAPLETFNQVVSYK